MAAPALIVTHANGDAPTVDGIFSGLSFFLVQKLPSRSTFVNKIQSNGGRVVKLEAQADHIIADHIRPVNCPVGSLSYTFIDKALENGTLPEPENHAAGAPKGTVRPPATGLPTKGTRTPFTAEDDKELYLWVKKHEARGASVKGNELYKGLEIRNPRHTFQAWRDRYVKRLIDRPPPGVNVEEVVNGEDDDDSGEQSMPAPRSTQQKGAKRAGPPVKKQKVTPGNEEFDEDEIERLVDMGGDIEDIEADRIEEAWDAFADTWSEHSAAAWRRFWDEVARPEYLKRLKATTKNGKDPERSQQATPDGTNNGQQQEVEESTSTSAPERPPSSSSLKRKRATASPRKQATYGRKKQKDGHDIFGDAGSDDESLPNGHESVAPPTAATGAGSIPFSDQRRSRQGTPQTARPLTQAIDLTGDQNGTRESSAKPTSDANKAAAMQLDDDFERMLADKTPRNSQQEEPVDDESEDPQDEALITSEANKAAAMQLDNGYEPTPHASHIADGDLQVARVLPRNAAIMQHSDGGNAAGLVTSELNREADDQLQRESLQSEEDEEEESRLPTSEPQRQNAASEEPNDENGHERASGSEHETVPHSEALASQLGDDDPSSMVQARGDALTEANLATQEEQHREPHVRGTDLPEDDEMQDQSDFVQYLQGLQAGVQKSGQSGLLPGARDAMVSGASQEAGMTTELNDVSMLVEAETSQQQSLHDQTFDELPMSSQQELDQIMDETLHWPESPKQAKANPAPQQESQQQSLQFETQVQYPPLPPQQVDDELFSSPEAPEEVRYPDLQHEEEQEQPKRRSFEELQARFDREVLGIEAPDDDEGDMVDDEDALGGGAGAREENEIDLEMPEPEGGFGFSSSQAWQSQQLREEQQDSQAVDSRNGFRQAEIDLEVPEPEGGFRFSSSPPKASQHSRVGASQEQQQAVHQPHVLEEEDQERFGTASANAAIEITSSSSSSSSELGPDLNQEQADDDEDEEEDDMPLDYPRALETQDIYNAETQFPELDIPSPPALPSSLPGSSSPTPQPSRTKQLTAQESQAALADTQKLSDDDVDEYVTRQSLVEGHPEALVIAALKCTSMRPELAELVLLDERLGKGFPNDVPGIWSEEEDAVLEGGDAGGLRRLEEKHGWRECEGRLEWLGEWRGDGDEEED